MNEGGAQDIETKSSAANDHHQEGVVDSCALLGFYHSEKRWPL